MITTGIDTYISLADAKSYLSTHPHATKWNDASTTDDQREWALKTAVSVIDSLPLKGEKYLKTQNMAFPRTFWDNSQNQYFSQDTPPSDIQNAQCLEAAIRLEFGDSIHLKNNSLGIKSMSLEGSSVQYNNDPKVLLSNDARVLMQKYIQNGIKIV